MPDIFDEIEKNRDVFDEIDSVKPLRLSSPDPALNPEGTITQDSTARQAVDALRGVGKDIGSGVSGGLALAKAGTGPLGQLMGLGFSYAGGSAGQGIEDILRGQQPQGFMNAVNRYHGAGMKGLQDQLMGTSVANLAERALAPNLAKMTPQDLNVSAFAKQNKLPMQPSDIVDSKISKSLEWVGDSTVTGDMLTNYYRRKLGENLKGMVEDVSQKLPNLTDKGTTGNVLMEGIKEAKQGVRAATQEAYAKKSSVLLELGDGKMADGTVSKPLEMSNFIETANKYRYALPEDHPIRQFLASIGDRSGVEGGKSTIKTGMTGKEVDEFTNQIWGKTWKDKQTRAIGFDLWDAVEKDLVKEEPYIWSTIKNAKDIKKLEKDFLANPTVRAIGRKFAQGNPDQLIPSLFRSGNIEEVNTILKALPQEAAEIAKERFVQNILDTSVKDGVFNPDKFLGTYSVYRDQIKNVMPEIGQNLDLLAETMRRSLKDVKAGDRPFNFGSFLKMGGSGGAAPLAASVMGPVGWVVPEGFSMMLAHSLRSPTGVLKKWLTTGLKPEAGLNMLKLGGRFVDFNNNNKGATP